MVLNYERILLILLTFHEQSFGTCSQFAGKILARVLMNRLIPAIAEDHLPETQCGFRANWGTTDMVFVLRQLQEKCREQNKELYVTFVDLTKAFDTEQEGTLADLGASRLPPNSSAARRPERTSHIEQQPL